MRIERYIFGSVRGYGQLARSSGISQADARFFDTVSFGFGQANDPAYAGSLLTRPAFFTYRVPAGRWAVVRVLPGQPDDNGRPTLLMIWLVFTRADWQGTLGRNPQALLDTSDLWRYDGEPTLSVLEITVPPGTNHVRPVLADRFALLLREVQHNAASKRSTIVSADDYTAEEIFTMVAIAPPQVQAKMTVAYRCLSNKFPVVLNLIANGRASVAVSRAMAGVPLSETESASGIEPPVFETDPSIVKSDRPVAEPLAPASLTASLRKTQMFNPTILILAVIAVVGPILSYIVAHNQDRALVEQKISDQSDLIKNLNQKTDLGTKRLDDLQRTVQQNSDQHDQDISKMQAVAAKKYTAIDQQFEDTKRKLEALAKKLEHNLGHVEANGDAVDKTSKSSATSRPSTLPTTREGKS